MDKPTIDMTSTPEGANPWYDMYLDKLLNWADDEHDNEPQAKCIDTRRGEKMIMVADNVIYVQF